MNEGAQAIAAASVFVDGVCTYNLEPSVLKKGLNAFSVTFPASAPKGTTFNDFSVTTPPLKR